MENWGVLDEAGSGSQRVFRCMCSDNLTGVYSEEGVQMAIVAACKPGGRGACKGRGPGMRARIFWDFWGQRGGRRWSWDENGGLVRRKLLCGHTSNHCLCLSLPAVSAGPGALQLCAPAFFLQGLLQTVLESILLEGLVPWPPL